MYVNVIFLEKFLIDSISGCYRTDVADTRCCRLFHHVSKLSGKHKFPFTRHNIYFDLKGIAAYLRPGKTSCNTNLILFIRHQVIVFLLPQKALKVLACDRYLLFAIFHDQTCCLTTDLTDQTLQISDTSFFRIIIDNFSKSAALNGKFAFLNSIGFHLLGNQMLLCNVLFLILCITADLNDLHSVKKRSWDSLNIVGCCNKQHL